MGWRYRKSLNLGKYFRMNFSKSGIGWSTGFKGFRYTKKADGGTRTTNTISGTGISYVKDYPDKTKSKNSIKPDINNMSPNKKKPYKNWLIVFAIILTIILIFKLNLFKLLGSIGLIYVLYIASYKYILKRKPPYALPANKIKFLRTRWIAILTLILFFFGAAVNSPSPASGQDTQQDGATLTDNNKHSNSAKSIAKSESIASSKSESESIARSESIASSKSESESTARTESIASSKSESESIKKAEESKKASESVAKKASSESAQRVAESNSIAESKAVAAKAASESARRASESAAQAVSTQKSTATNNAAASTNNTTGIRWAVEDGYTWATRKGHSRRLSPGEPLPSGYHYQTGN
ncbi:DUF4236 domain-containing protein [Pediococcus pentosaceus]|uniref:DUF4236 domain-containing protein n=1 Tax=Pediococcus pentosaceus TaxID=1255 RepID=UPI00132F5AAB|nr:DUF4236 domain-containing protein [Pediococcus pentosaceus]KAF0349736.1 DUF4236 domain-containing protein [Pediococcus pentosaceus]MBF7105710.1 DUF4236 domain-containing protein [Pediococcus pentosaceus]